MPPFALERLEQAFTGQLSPQQPSTPPELIATLPSTRELEDSQGLMQSIATAAGWGEQRQGNLLRDIHSALLRLLEGLDLELQEAPTLAGYGASADLAPQEAYRCAAPCDELFSTVSLLP